MATAPLLGQLVARVPFHQARIVLAIVASTALVWAVVLLWPGPAPLGLLVIGFVLDRLAPGGPSSYTLGDFRVAMSVQYLFWGFGAVQIWRYRHKTIGRLRHQGEARWQRGSATAFRVVAALGGSDDHEQPAPAPGGRSSTVAGSTIGDAGPPRDSNHNIHHNSSFSALYP